MMHHQALTLSREEQIKQLENKDAFYSIYNAHFKNSKSIKAIEKFCLGKTNFHMNYGPQAYNNDHLGEDLVCISIAHHNQAAALRFKLLLMTIRNHPKNYLHKSKWSEKDKETALSNITDVLTKEGMIDAKGRYNQSLLKDLRTQYPFSFIMQFLHHALFINSSDRTEEKKAILPVVYAATNIEYITEHYSESSSHQQQLLLLNKELNQLLKQQIDLEKDEEDDQEERLAYQQRNQQRITKKIQQIEQTKLLILEQIILDQYFKIRQTQGYFNSRLANELEHFIKQPTGLDLLRKYPELDVPHYITKGTIAPQLHELKRGVKRIALIDIDDHTLVLNSKPLKINQPLIDKLKHEFDEVILITQKNRRTLIDDLTTEDSKDYMYTKDIVTILKAHNLTVRVSTPPFKNSAPQPSPFYYYDSILKPFEKKLAKENNSNISSHLNQEIAAENDHGYIDPSAHYRQLYVGIKSENPHCDLEISVFKDNTENLTTINNAFSAKEILDEETSISEGEEDNASSAHRTSNKILSSSSSSDTDENKLSHSKRVEPQAITPVIKPSSFYMILSYPHSSNHICHKLTREELQQVSNRPKNYFNLLFNAHITKPLFDAYQEPEIALQQYITQRKLRERKDNSAYQSFLGKLRGMSAEIKTKAAQKLIDLILWEREFKLIDQAFKETPVQSKELEVKRNELLAKRPILTQDDIIAANCDHLGEIISLYRDQLPTVFMEATRQYNIGKHGFGFAF